MEKETYQFKREDFKPIKGLVIHYQRTLKDPNHLNESYQAQDAIRTAGLFFYNAIIIGTPIFGLAKLLIR
jgi:hypothetical protein